MGRGIGSLLAMTALACVLVLNSDAGAQTSVAPAENAAPSADNAVMLTVFLKHDQSRPLSELMRSSRSKATIKPFPRPASKS